MLNAFLCVHNYIPQTFVVRIVPAFVKPVSVLQKLKNKTGNYFNTASNLQAISYCFYF